MTMNTTAKTTSTKKHWLLVTFAAAALTLSACGQQDEAPMEAEPAAEATDTAMASDEHAGMTEDEHAGMMDEEHEGMHDDMMEDGMMEDDVAIADDSEMMDGTETEESTSTY